LHQSLYLIQHQKKTATSFLAIMNKLQTTDLYKAEVSSELLKLFEEEDYDLEFYRNGILVLIAWIDLSSGIPDNLPVPSTPLETAVKEPCDEVSILITENGTLLVDNKVSQVEKLESNILKFIDSTNSTVFIILSSDRQATYKFYLEVTDKIVSARKVYRNELSMREYDKAYEDLNEEQIIFIRNQRKINFSEY
jgi:biopolymer transport protein ExbD